MDTKYLIQEFYPKLKIHLALDFKSEKRGKPIIENLLSKSCFLTKNKSEIWRIRLVIPFCGNTGTNSLVYKEETIKKLLKNDKKKTEICNLCLRTLHKMEDRFNWLLGMSL